MRGGLLGERGGRERRGFKGGGGQIHLAGGRWGLAIGGWWGVGGDNGPGRSLRDGGGGGACVTH